MFATEWERSSTSNFRQPRIDCMNSLPKGAPRGGLYGIRSLPKLNCRRLIMCGTAERSSSVILQLGNCRAEKDIGPCCLAYNTTIESLSIWRQQIVFVDTFLLMKLLLQTLKQSRDSHPESLDTCLWDLDGSTKRVVEELYSSFWSYPFWKWSQHCLQRYDLDFTTERGIPPHKSS